MKSTPHGSTFIRFPMELNGKSCYDTIFYSILEASGYQLRWSKYFASIDTIYLHKKRSKSQCSNNCRYVNNDNNSNKLQTSSYREFIQLLTR